MPPFKPQTKRFLGYKLPFSFPTLFCENWRRDAVSFYDECIEKNRNVVYKRTASGLHYGPLDKVVGKLSKLNCNSKISSTKIQSVRKCLWLFYEATVIIYRMAMANCNKVRKAFVTPGIDLKFGHSEKATKIWNNQIFVAFSGCPNFNWIHHSAVWWRNKMYSIRLFNKDHKLCKISFSPIWHQFIGLRYFSKH